MNTAQKYVRITVYYNGNMGVNSVLNGKSIAIKIPYALAIEVNADELRDMCYDYLRSKIPNSTVEHMLSWKDINEWEHTRIEENDLLDSSYDAEIDDTDYFYKD